MNLVILETLRRVFGDVEGGAALPGLYPRNEDAKARYEAWNENR